MPVQKPGKSKQDYGTPLELLTAVEARWGKIWIDLAASDINAKAPYYFTAEDDYLKQAPVIGPDALCWCNPPFENLAPWCAKWRADAEKGARIIALVPASIGSEWFASYVFGHARVIGLRPRLTFEGCKDPYPKDCMLMLWGIEEPGFELWRWKS